MMLKKQKFQKKHLRDSHNAKINRRSKKNDFRQYFDGKTPSFIMLLTLSAIVIQKKGIEKNLTDANFFK